MKNNLEDIFKVLKDYSEEAPDLMGAIHAQRSKPIHRAKNHFRRNIFKYAAGLVVLISFSFFFINQNKNDDLGTNQKGIATDHVDKAKSHGEFEQAENRGTDSNADFETSPSIAHNENETDFDSQSQDITPTEFEVENGNDKTTEPTEIKPTTVKPNSTIDQSGFNELGSNQTPSVEQGADSESTNQDQPVVQLTPEQDDSEVEINSDRQNDTEIENDQKEQVEIASNENVEEADEKADSESNEADIVVTDESDDTEGNKEADDTKGDLNSDPAIAQNEPVASDLDSTTGDENLNSAGQDPIKPVSDKTHPLGKWSIELAAGMGRAGNGIMSTNEASLIRTQSENQVRSFQASALFNYELNDNWEAQLGFNYLTNKTMVDFTNKYQVNLMNVTSKEVIVFDYPGAPGRKVTVHDTTYSTEDRADEYKNTNVIQSVQIPLSLKHNWYFGKFGVYVKGGMNLEVYKMTEGRVLDADLEWNSLNQDAYIRRNLLTSYQYGAGVSYLLNDRTAFIMEGISQRSRGYIWAEENPVREVQINNSLRAGLKIYF